MPYRSAGVTLSLARVGAGSVVLDSPAEDLLPNDRNKIDAPSTPSTVNLRLQNGLAIVRPGYVAFGGAAASGILGCFTAVFDNGTVRPLRFTIDGVEEYSSSVWNDITGAVTLNAATGERVRAAMVRRVGTVDPKNEVMAVNGTDAPFAWTGSGNIVSVSAAPEGAKDIVSFLNRAFVLNCKDASGDRKGSRVQWSAINDPRTWTGITAGFGDLLDDPYDCQRFSVMSGGLVVYKGGAYGGSIWRGTPTGQSLGPVRYDAINPNTGIGILLPNTLLLLSPGVAFFVGHDGFYLYDGLRQLTPLPFDGCQRKLLERLNYDALYAAIAWYKPRTMEIHIAIPTGDSVVPTETWVYNRTTKQTYGPYQYTNAFTAAAPLVLESSVTWADAAPYTWENSPWSSWDAITGVRGSMSILLGASDGTTFVDRDLAGEGDNGADITGTYEAAPMRVAGRVIQKADGTFMAYSERDGAILMDVTVAYQDNARWTPVVQYRLGLSESKDAWVTISDGLEIGTNTGRLKRKTYTADAPAGEWFQIRVRGTNAMYLHSITTEFTYGGSDQAAEV